MVRFFRKRIDEEKILDTKNQLPKNQLKIQIKLKQKLLRICQTIRLNRHSRYQASKI